MRLLLGVGHAVRQRRAARDDRRRPELGLDDADPRLPARRLRRRHDQPAARLDRDRRRALLAQRHGLGHQQHLPPGRHRHRDRRASAPSSSTTSPTRPRPRSPPARPGARWWRAAHGQLAERSSPAKSHSSPATSPPPRATRSATPTASASPSAFTTILIIAAHDRARRRAVRVRARAQPRLRHLGRRGEAHSPGRAGRGRGGGLSFSPALKAPAGAHSRRMRAQAGADSADRQGPRGSACTARRPSRACWAPPAGARTCRTALRAVGGRCAAGAGRGHDRSLGARVHAARKTARRAPAIIVAYTTMKTFNRLLGFLQPYKRGLGISWALASLAMVMTVALPELTGRAVAGDHERSGARPRPHSRRRAPTSATRCSCSRLVILAVGARALGLHVLASHDRRAGVAGGRIRPARADVRPAAAPRAGLLRPPADRAADVARDRRSRRRCASSSATGSCSSCSRSSRSRSPASVMLAINPGLGLIALVPVPFVVLISYRYGRRARPAIQETQQRIAELTADAEENISGVRVVKAFAREQPPADALPGHRRARVQPGDGRHAPGSDLQPRDRLPAPARPRRRAAAGRRVGDPRAPHARPVHRLLPVREHADHADALARRDAQPRPARHRLGRAHLPAARPRAAPDRCSGRTGAARRATGTCSCAT